MIALNDDVEYVSVPGIVAKGIDYLDRLSKKRSPNGRVETAADWKILTEVYKVWRSVYVEDYAQFRKSAIKFKSANADHRGITKEGGALIQHQLEVPEKLYQLIETMFPNQNWDKAFVRKFMSELPEFDVTKL